MNRIFLSITISIILSGCVSSKVEHLHTTTTELSANIEKFVELSNRTADLNRTLKLQDEQSFLSKQLSEKNLATAENSFNESFKNLHDNKTYLEMIRVQNKLLIEYFKKLPLILENKEIDSSGLVTKIDMLNQALENNISDDGVPKEGLKKGPSDIINHSLTNGFNAYQNHIFRKSIQEAYPTIIKALVSQKNFFKMTALLEQSRNLNSEYFSSYKKLKDSYIQKYQPILITENGNKNNLTPTYTQDDINALNELVDLPFKPIDLKQNFQDEPKVQSKDYEKYCVPNEDDRQMEANFIEAYGKLNSRYLINISNKKDKPKQVIFDFDRRYMISGEKLTCELINITGLLYENDIKNIDLSTLGVKINRYNQMLDFLTKKYIKETKEK